MKQYDFRPPPDKLPKKCHKCKYRGHGCRYIPKKEAYLCPKEEENVG